ncbi:golgin subfamily member protein [Salix suchowensis]|nr:golgin subfamily member protein [Salix suchowensis]
MIVKTLLSVNIASRFQERGRKRLSQNGGATGCLQRSMDFIKPLSMSRHVYKSKHSKQWKRGENIRRNRERRERIERLKTDMVEISKGQERIKEGQREIRQKFEEIESEGRKLKEETMNIVKQSECNQIRINLMFSTLKARQENNFAHADNLTRLLRAEMEKQGQGNPGQVG